MSIRNFYALRSRNLKFRCGEIVKNRIDEEKVNLSERYEDLKETQQKYQQGRYLFLK